VWKVSDGSTSRDVLWNMERYWCAVIRMKKQRTAVLIPCFNEAEHIGKFIDDLLKEGISGEDILIYSDGSTDGTVNIVSRKKVRVMDFTENKGKASAIINGMFFLGSCNYDNVVIVDGDGQFTAKDTKIFYDISDGKCMFQGLRTDMPFRHEIANNLINWFFEHLFNIPSPDVTCGLKVLPMDMWEKMRIISGGYAIDAEMLKEAYRVGEVFYYMVDCRYNEKSGIVRGVRMTASILFEMVKWKLND
jgi:glycosyltransferase involved in cell wall biosynthesis